MKKKLIALIALMLVCATMTGCVSTEGLKKVPQGERPAADVVFADLEPQFPSDTSVKNQLMMIATEVKTAQDIDRMREKYDEFLYNAYIYVVGPYNFTSYCAADGHSMTVYYDNMINHMNTMLSEWEPTAWSAISEAEWGAQLKNEYASLMCTPESIRTVYPTSDETVSSQLQNMYTAREDFAAGVESAYAESDKEMLLDDLFATRETIANTLQYASYPEYVVVKRDKMPYDLESLLKLAQLVKENLAPAVKAAQTTGAPDLSAQEWNEKLPALAQRFDDYEEDLLYVLNNGAYVVEEGVDEVASRHFAYQLYQHDLSAGKAILAGDDTEALHVLYGLGLEARNMNLEQKQWSMSTLALYDSVQENAFAAMCFNELDALGLDEAAKQQLVYLMAKDVCRAAMELEVLVELYKNPVMAQSDREALVQELCEAYGVDGAEDFFEMSEDVLMGTLNCAGNMLGGLYGLTLHELDNRDSAAAEAVLAATLSVYNADNPIAVGYAAGLGNPFSTDGIKAVAEMVK